MRLFERALSALGAIELRDLLDWQQAVTCHASRLAADRASVREIDALRTTIAPLAADPDPIVARRAFSRFLIEVAASSRSSRVSKAAIELQVEYAPLLTLVLRTDAARREISERAEHTLDAIAARDGEQAYSRMMELTSSLGERIQRARHELVRSAERSGDESGER